MRHTLRETAAAYRRSPWLVLVSVLAVGLSLFIIGLFALTAFNLRTALRQVEERVEVVAYLREGTTPEQVRAAEVELRNRPEVMEVRYVSKTEALAVAVQDLPEFRDVFSGLGANPLPASFEIRLTPQHREPQAIERLAQRLLVYPFVEDVAFGREWVERLVILERIAAGATTIIGGSFAVVAAIIIATAVRIGVSARREEIEIMRLVGATNGYIRSPFLLEGASAGLLGAVLALAMTRAAFEFVSVLLLPIAWLPTAWLATSLVLGGTFGLVASAVSVSRQLKLV